MKSWILTLGAIAMVGSACNPVVLEPLKGTQAVEETPSGSTVLAIRGSDVDWQSIDPFPGPNGPSVTDPDTLVLFFSSDPQVCGDSTLAARCTGATPFWQMIIAIPPQLVRNGPIDLYDVHITTIFGATDMDGTLDCPQVGHLGPGLVGTLTLTGVGTAALSAQLEGVTLLTRHFIPDGVYIPRICGDLPPVQPPTPALAFHGADLPAAPGGGPTPAADSLVVFLGTLPDTCQDPWAAAECSSPWLSRLSFTLPLALQTPGLINLADPAIASTYTIDAAAEGGPCAPPAGPYPNGTIEILSSDAGGLTFKIYQSPSYDVAVYQSSPGVPPSHNGLAFDGLYSASICP
jgi:hypothetical protein